MKVKCKSIYAGPHGSGNPGQIIERLYCPKDNLRLTRQTEIVKGSGPAA